MFKRRRLFGLLLVLALAMMLVLAACGGDDDDDGAANETATAEVQATETAEADAAATETAEAEAEAEAAAATQTAEAEAEAEAEAATATAEAEEEAANATATAEAEEEAANATATAEAEEEAANATATAEAEEEAANATATAEAEEEAANATATAEAEEEAANATATAEAEEEAANATATAEAEAEAEAATATAEAEEEAANATATAEAEEEAANATATAEAEAAATEAAGVEATQAAVAAAAVMEATQTAEAQAAATETAEAEAAAATQTAEAEAEAEAAAATQTAEAEAEAEAEAAAQATQAAETEPDEAPAETDFGVVTIGMNAEYPPFEFVNEDGEIDGFDPALVALIAERAGFEYELVNTRWDGIFVALASGEFDMVASAATITAEREEIVDFSNPYFYANQRIAVLEDRADEISTIEDLAGLRIGVQSGTTGDIFASEEVPGAEVVRYDEITLAFQALGNGDVDAIINDGPTSADIIEKNPDLGAVLVGEPLSEEFYGIAVQPDKPELLDAVNAALEELVADGSYRELYLEWFGVEPDPMFQPEAVVDVEMETETEDQGEEVETEDAEMTGDEGEDAGTTETEGDEAAMQTDFGVVTVGMNAEYPPFEFVNEDGEIDGFDPALVALIAERAGFEYELVNTRWDGIFVALASGEFDMVASAATITDEREEIVDFSNPYFYANQRIAVLEDRADELSTIEDLAGLRIGVQSGTTGDIFASEEVPGAEVVRYDEITLAFQALANGDVDAIINDGPTSADIIEKNPDLGAVLVGEPLSEEFYGIAVQPDMPELLDAVNAALEELVADGTYAELYMEWFGVQPDEMFLPEGGMQPEMETEAEGEDAETTEAETEETTMETDFGVVTVGMNAEYPPFEFVNEDGEIDGFDPALVGLIAEQAGFEYELVNTRWDGIFVALASGEFDMVASAATITDEREEIVDFSNPYFYANQRIAVLEPNASTMSTVEDLAGLRIGVQSGTTGDIFASEEVPGAEVVRYDEITLAFQALANGDVDAIINDGPTSADIIEKNPDLNAVLVGEPLSEEFYGIAVQPDMPELLDAVNAALEELIANGTYADLYMEWFGVQPDPMFLPAE